MGLSLFSLHQGQCHQLVFPNPQAPSGHPQETVWGLHIHQTWTESFHVLSTVPSAEKQQWGVGVGEVVERKGCLPGETHSRVMSTETHSVGHQPMCSASHTHLTMWLLFLVSFATHPLQQPMHISSNDWGLLFNSDYFKMAWRRKWRPTPGFLSEEFHEQNSQAGYSPWDCKELGTPEHILKCIFLLTHIIPEIHSCKGVKQFRAI